MSLPSLLKRPLGLNGRAGRLPAPRRPLPLARADNSCVVTMRDRSKNRKPLQRGRYLSIEAVQAIQALKRASGESIERVLRSKVRRLIKFDMMAVLAELQSQNEGYLALQVFEDVRGEHWYNPKFPIYADMVRVLAKNGLLEEVDLIYSYLKMENFKADTEGFNALLSALLEFGFTEIAMDCFLRMKVWEVEPDECTFRTLIHELEAKGEIETSSTVRQEAKQCFGGSLDFLEENKEMVLTTDLNVLEQPSSS